MSGGKQSEKHSIIENFPYENDHYWSTIFKTFNLYIYKCFLLNKFKINQISNILILFILYFFNSNFNFYKYISNK